MNGYTEGSRTVVEIQRADMGSAEFIHLDRMDDILISTGKPGRVYRVGHSYRGRYIETARFTNEAEARKAANKLWKNRINGYGWKLNF